jgi:hypothetical protein
LVDLLNQPVLENDVGGGVELGVELKKLLVDFKERAFHGFRLAKD